VSAAVVSGMDAPPVFEAPEHVFDFVALFVEGGVLGIAVLRFDFEGMQAATRRLAKAARNQSAS
jgi:hypothetical protein